MVGLGATALQWVFVLSMALVLGSEAPLSAPVCSSCAVALLLPLAPVRTFAFSLDRLFATASEKR